MFTNGNVTVLVSEMDSAIRYYTQGLGLRLTNRFGGQWATIEAGPSYWTTDEIGAGLIIGLEPRSAKSPEPGTTGSVGFGLETYEPLESVIPRLRQQGVQVAGDIVSFEAGNSVAFADGDGHRSYVHEFPPFMLEEGDAQDNESAGAEASMLSGGHAIVYVADMGKAVQFYSAILGLKLTNRFADQFATVEAGRLVVALHPAGRNTPKSGSRGSMVLGLVADGDISRTLSQLAAQGVRTAGGAVNSGLRGHVEIQDPDGNTIRIYEPVVAAFAPELAENAA